MNLIKTNKIHWLASIATLFISVGVNSQNNKAEENNFQDSFQDKVKQDIQEFRDFYSKKFPNVDINEFKDGVYAIDEKSREQWLEIEEFSPYEISVEDGEEAFGETFANGKSYIDCFPKVEDGIRQNYPYFSTETNQVITVELSINQCREANGEMPLAFGKGKLADISAYISFTSREKLLDIKVPNQKAYDAYMAGKKFFYSKRGQLNFACADCHLKIAGSMLRADLLSPALGHPTAMPVYRSSWGELGTLHKRYAECNKNVRAKPLELQGENYRNLEYFQTIMSQGMEVNGPSSRK